ncbi:MAG: CFI-box-CTERM domain-containing protein, partial [Bacteroidales bacterium]
EYSDDRGVGGVDFANEVYVGRIPVYEGVADLDSVLSKIIRYGGTPALGSMSPMSDTSWRLNALLPMSYLEGSTDTAYLGEAMKSDYLSSAGYSSWTMYMQGSVCAEADSLFSSDEELLDLSVRERWKVIPYGLVWWNGHGNTLKTFLGYEDCGWGEIMSTRDAPLLNDNFPSFVFQGACDNGRPELSYNLGTALLYNGAIATLSSSRVSWYSQGSWNTGMKYNCDIASIAYFCGKEMVGNDKKVAVALYDVKSDMGISGELWGDESWMNLFDFNLYGDPVASLKAITGNLLIISSGPGGTTDPEPGEYIYDDETDVSIRATAETNNRFSGWSGDVPEGQENDNPLIITVDSVISIQANFIRQYNLTVASSAGGTTNPEPGAHTYDDGTEVILTAIPENFYNFSGWLGDVPEGQGNDNPITITMDSGRSIQASFVLKYDLTISVEGGGITSPLPGTHSYGSGETIQVRAIPDNKYEFSGWSGDVSGSMNPVKITMDSAKSIKAGFIKKKGCFIASAAYGTSLHPYVKILQDFRDTYLMPSKFGRLLVLFYYRYSPLLADFIAKHKALRVAVRVSLMPLVAFSYSMLQYGPVITAFILVCIFVIPVVLISFYLRKPGEHR